MNDIAVPKGELRHDVDAEQVGTMNRKGCCSSGLRVHRCVKRTDLRSEDSDRGAAQCETVTVARSDVEEVTSNAGGGNVSNRHLA